MNPPLARRELRSRRKRSSRCPIMKPLERPRQNSRPKKLAWDVVGAAALKKIRVGSSYPRLVTSRVTGCAVASRDARHRICHRLLL
jgi:hypothetical protein